MKQVITKAGLCTLLGVAFLSLGLGACKKDTPTPTPPPTPTPTPTPPPTPPTPTPTPTPPPTPQPGDDTELPKGTFGYITKVLDYRPGVGQFTNKYPEYQAGDTQASMNQKVLEAIGHDKQGLISLGGWGGYVVLGFDHTIPNTPKKRDFRILGNAFEGQNNQSGFRGGSCEPGIIYVAYDANKNGRPDEDEWYEIAGSSTLNPKNEAWYTFLATKKLDLRVFRDYEITYERPKREEAEKESGIPSVAIEQYVHWRDNKGGEGWIPKNTFHQQTYYPGWIGGNKYTLRGTRLPQNAYNQNPPDAESAYFILLAFKYGYADNLPNTEGGSTIDIDWAMDKDGRAVHLPGVDFIRIQTGVHQINGWLGECSTEVSGITYTYQK